MPVFRKGNWPKVAIGGLVLVNLVLLAALVLREPGRLQSAEPAAGGGSFATQSRMPSTGTSTLSASPDDETSTPSRNESSVSATPSATPHESADGAVRSARVLAVNSDKLAWRAELGRCPTNPNLEVSRNGGRTWQQASVGLQSITRLRSYSESSVFAIGGAEKCKARYVATGGPDISWEPSQRLLRQSWYRLPGAVHRIHAPYGAVSDPCGKELSDFAGLGQSNAAALCADGRVRLTQDSGNNWRNLEGRVEGLALGADDSAYAVALRRADCEGVAVTVLESGAEQVDKDDVHCVPTAQDEAGELAIGMRDSVVWLWAGDSVLVSTDQGQRWRGR